MEHKNRRDKAWLAGPTTSPVKFSGQTTDKQGKVLWRIYSCELDGSGLKAHTPKENRPVPAYEFPNGKTAYEVAAAWALQEIKVEDALRRKATNALMESEEQPLAFSLTNNPQHKIDFRKSFEPMACRLARVRLYLVGTRD